MSHIFISYSRKDLDFAQKIVDALAANNLDTWIDWKSIPKGEDWEQEIYRGIEEADAFLFLVSLDSVASEMCNKEIAHAVNNGKRILPIFISNVENKEVYKVTEKFLKVESKEEINRRNFIFCRKEMDDFDEAIEEIQKTIHTDYEWLKYHTRLQVKALEWERTNDASRLLRGRELREAEEKLVDVDSQKDPQSTNQQRLFILESRKNEEKIRRRLIMGLSFGLVAVTVLAFFAWQQRNLAISETNAKATALVDEEHARSTAQAEEKRAEEQARIARARELAAQAQLLSNQQAGMLEPSMLLAIESIKLSTSPAAVQLLNQGAQLLPSSITLDTDEFILHTTLSLDEKYILVRTETQAIVFETQTGKEYLRIELTSGYKETDENSQTPNGDVFGGAFDPFSQWLVTQRSNDEIQVWNIPTGELRNTIPINNPAVDAHFSPDGRYLAILTERTLRVVAFPGGEAIFDRDLETKITALSFSKDSQLLACAYASSVQVWDTLTGKSLALLSHDNSVIDLAFVQNQAAHEMLSSITAETLRIWDVETQSLVIETSSLDRLLALSDDGLMFASAGEKSFRVRSTETGNEVLGAATVGDVVGASFSLNNSRLIIIKGEPLGGPGEVSLWNFETGFEIARIPYNFWVGKYAGGNERFFSTANNVSVKLWNIEQGGSLGRQVSEKLSTEGAFSQSGNWFVTGGIDGVWLWDTLDQVQLAHIHIRNLSRLSLSPDDQHLAVQVDRRVNVYNVPSGEQTQSFQHTDVVKTFAFNSDGSRLAAVSGSTIWIWDITSGELTEKIEVSSPGIEHLSFSSDNKILLAADGETIFAWGIPGGEQIFNAIYPGGVIEFIPNSHKYYGDVFAGGGSQASLYDLDKEKELFRTAQGNAPLVHTEDGKWLASANETTVTVWDTDNGQERFAIEANNTVLALAFSQDGNLLAVGGGELYSGAGEVSIWDMDSGQKVGQFTQDRVVYAVAFSSDSQLLATGSWDDTARVWDVVSGQELFRLLSPGGVVTAIDFSPDDRWLMYRTDDDRVHISQWRADDLISSACKLIDYEFSDSEWETYFPDEEHRVTCPKVPAGE